MVNKQLYKAVQIYGHLLHHLKNLANQHQQVIWMCSVLGHAKDEYGGQLAYTGDCCWWLYFQKFIGDVNYLQNKVRVKENQI